MVNVFPVPVCPYAKIVPGNTIFSTSNSKMDHTGLKIKKKTEAPRAGKLSYLEIGNQNIKNYFSSSQCIRG